MRVAVIGANYGDEGKGLIVDALCRRLYDGVAMRTDQPPPVVVRFNGGAQAGHTVVDGARRHVFGHIGSGYFAGASTHLSVDFVSNPTLLARELTKLRSLPEGDANMCISADPWGVVTTPFDMIINQAVEYSRGNTCGLGINETINRSVNGPPLLVEDIFGDSFGVKYQRIKMEWFQQRCRQLGIDAGHALLRVDLDAHEREFLTAIGTFRERVQMKVDQHLDQEENVVFEGAQGLLLDQTRGHFPMVTRSHTGINNVLTSFGAPDKAIYVTRWYLTRHGDGPFYEKGFSRDPGFTDRTNVTNDWQGRLRYGPLNVCTLIDRIQTDAKNIPWSVAVTHLDETIDRAVEYRQEENEMTSCDVGNFIFNLAGRDVKIEAESYGPMASHVKWTI